MRYRYSIYKPFEPIREQVEFSDLNKLELYLGAIPKDCVCRVDRLVSPLAEGNKHWLYPEDANEEIWEQIFLLKW